MTFDELIERVEELTSVVDILSKELLETQSELVRTRNMLQKQIEEVLLDANSK